MDENDVNNISEVTEIQAMEEVTEVAPGTKTDSAKLLESLKEEREKRRLAEARAAEREAELLAFKNAPETDAYSDEGKVLLTKISQLESKLISREEQELLQSVQSKFPQLKDKEAEFEQFRQDNPGMRVETQAKAFLVENDLFEAPIVRKGLEKVSSGGRVPAQVGMSSEDIDNLRTNNPRKFRDMLKSGQLK